MLSEVLLAEVSKTKDHALSLILSVAICPGGFNVASTFLVLSKVCPNVM